jgi:hypothetical protein
MYSIIDLDAATAVAAAAAPEKFDEIKSLFSIKEIINPLPHIHNCISVSLFYQNPDNEYPEQHQKRDLEYWRNKYYLSLIRFIEDFRKSDLAESGQWKMRIYLENCLLQSELVDINHLFSAARGRDRLEIYHMATNSIGAQPGMLWRFLAYDDRELDTAFVCDIDDRFEDRRTKILSFHNSPQHCVFGRYLSYSKDNFNIDKERNVPPLNYATVIGCMNGMRPKKSGISIKKCMIDYILWRINRVNTSAKPWEEFDDHDTSRFSAPIRNHKYGWGGWWTVYGFDERFLKHVIFPYFARRGEVFTWTHEDPNDLEKLPGENPVKIDYDFCLSCGANIFQKL